MPGGLFTMEMMNMTNCPVEECKGFQKLETLLCGDEKGEGGVLGSHGVVSDIYEKLDDKISATSVSRFFYGILGLVIICSGLMIGTWARTNGLDQDRLDAKDREKRLTILEVQSKATILALEQLNTKSDIILQRQGSLQGDLREHIAGNGK
jgi:hypothetical protein